MRRGRIRIARRTGQQQAQASGNPFAALPAAQVAILGGICDHGDDTSKCAKCSITLEVQRHIDAGLPVEHLMFIYIRLAAELIGADAGGEPKHKLLISNFGDWLKMGVKLVEAGQ